MGGSPDGYLGPALRVADAGQWEAAVKVPSNWSRMGFTVKAAYLCSTRQARDYSEACSMLAKRGGRRKHQQPAIAEVVQRMEQQKLF